MKTFQLVLALCMCLLTGQALFAVSAPAIPVHPTTTETAVKANPVEKKMTKKEKRAARKSLRKAIKAKIKELRKDSDISLGVLIIIAILLPPLAMLLYDGLSTRFWLSLLLTLLFYLPGLIYTLVVILGDR